MKQLESAVHTVNEIVKRYTDKYGVANFNNFSDAEKKSLAAACALAKTVKSLLDTPILMENGALTKESEKVIKSIP